MLTKKEQEYKIKRGTRIIFFLNFQSFRRYMNIEQWTCLSKDVTTYFSSEIEKMNLFSTYIYKLHTKSRYFWIHLFNFLSANAHNIWSKIYWRDFYVNRVWIIFRIFAQSSDHFNNYKYKNLHNVYKVCNVCALYH